MRPGAARRCVVLLAGLALAGCAAQRLTAGGAEWEAYRATRVGASTEVRLAAAAEYLEAWPEGSFAEQVAEDFDQAELQFWREVERDRAGLERYLSTLPRGPHAREAAERLADLARAAGRRRTRVEELSEEGRELEERLADAAAYRREFVRSFAAWVARLATVQSFGQGTPALPHPVIHAFRLPDPRGRCQDDVCRKALSFAYAIPDGGRLRPRRAFMDVTLRLDRGRVREVEIAGPELFSRLGEALLLVPLTPDDARGRARAVARVLALVGAQVEGELPAARCSDAPTGAAPGQPPRAPASSPVEPAARVLLRRACGGRELIVMTSAADAEDRVLVRALPVSATP